jgi:hypothetical protein
VGGPQPDVNRTSTGRQPAGGGVRWPVVVSKAPAPDVALAAAATCVAAAFALILFDRWLRRRRPHDQAWAISLAFFGIGTGALWWGFARGWSSVSFRLFYLAGAILNVPWLALGTVYLLGGRRLGDHTKGWLIALSGVSVGVMMAAPLRTAVPARGLPAGRDMFGVAPRVFAAVGSGVAALVIIGGAIWSAARLWRLRSSSAPVEPARPVIGKVVVGNIVIAAGTLLLASAGTLNARLGAAQAFAVTTLAGIIVLFAGFVITSAPPKRSTVES